MDWIDLSALRAVVFGLAVGGYAGPAARRIWDLALSRQIRAAKDLALGAALACFTAAVVAVAVAARLAAWRTVDWPLSVRVASGALLVLGALLAAAALFRTPARAEVRALGDDHALLPAGYRITMRDPRPWLLTLAFALQLPLPETWEEGPRYAVFIFIGSLAGLFAYAALARVVRKSLPAARCRTVNLVAALTIIGLAADGIATL